MTTSELIFICLLVFMVLVACCMLLDSIITGAISRLPKKWKEKFDREAGPVLKYDATIILHKKVRSTANMSGKPRV